MTYPAVGLATLKAELIEEEINIKFIQINAFTVHRSQIVPMFR